MGVKEKQFQISQQLRVFLGRIKQAERDQQAAIAALQQAKQNAQAAEQRLAHIRMQAQEAACEFAAHAASEQTRIWRDTTNLRQVEAVHYLEQCERLIHAAADDVHLANRALQKLQLQNDQIVQRQRALSKEKRKRLEAAVDDDRNAANTISPHHAMTVRL